MTHVEPSALTTITGGGDCYRATIDLFGLEIGIRIGSCEMK